MAANNSRGVLKFDGGGAQKVLKLNYGVQRQTDVSGRVASDPNNALIKISVEATDDSKILESLLNGKYKPTTGEVTFNKAHEEGALINLKWNNGYVIEHELDFDAINDNNMLITFTVSAEKIEYGNSAYEGVWPGI